MMTVRGMNRGCLNESWDPSNINYDPSKLGAIMEPLDRFRKDLKPASRLVPVEQRHEEMAERVYHIMRTLYEELGLLCTCTHRLQEAPDEYGDEMRDACLKVKRKNYARFLREQSNTLSMLCDHYNKNQRFKNMKMQLTYNGEEKQGLTTLEFTPTEVLGGQKKCPKGKPKCDGYAGDLQLESVDWHTTMNDDRKYTQCMGKRCDQVMYRGDNAKGWQICTGCKSIVCFLCIKRLQQHALSRSICSPNDVVMSQVKVVYKPTEGSFYLEGYFNEHPKYKLDALYYIRRYIEEAPDMYYMYAHMGSDTSPYWENNGLNTISRAGTIFNEGIQQIKFTSLGGAQATLSHYVSSKFGASSGSLKINYKKLERGLKRMKRSRRMEKGYTLAREAAEEDLRDLCAGEYASRNVIRVMATLKKHITPDLEIADLLEMKTILEFDRQHPEVPSWLDDPGPENHESDEVFQKRCDEEYKRIAIRALMEMFKALEKSRG